MGRKIITLETLNYEVTIDQNWVDAHFIKDLARGQDHILITDDVVHKYYNKHIDGLNVVVVPHGESSKEFEVYLRIVEQMASFKLTRQAVVIAFGGGVIGDLAGFAAATYMRGVDFIQIPTTLLAMVDSSIGGKVGVNLHQYKNVVGAFYQPKAVYVDSAFLKTLPEREWANGMAEVIKVALGFDASLFEKLELQTTEWFKQNIQDIIYEACCLKANCVTQDEKDKGIRNLLNLGHTLGHAIETYYGFSMYYHGEAVGIGMAAKAQMAYASGTIDEKTYQRILALLIKYGLPTALCEDINEDGLYKIFTRDKKRDGDLMTWVKIEGIGEIRLESTPVDTLFADFVGGLKANAADHKNRA